MIRCVFAILAGLLAAVAPLAAQLSKAELGSLLEEANALFREANEEYAQDPAAAVDLYRRAALRYERIARDGGVQNGRLFYNIGNAYFRSEDIGRAILNYRRAESYIPGDPNLAQNLAYARSRRQDSFEERQQTRVLQTLLFFHYDLAPGTRAVLLALFSSLFWGLAAVKLLRSRWMPRWPLAVTGLVAVLFAGSLAAEAAVGASRQSGVILAHEVVARKGDGASYEPSFTDSLHAGTEFVLVESRSDWRHVELPDGRRCWLPASSVGLLELPSS